jgi:hypothetical protein
VEVSIEEPDTDVDDDEDLRSDVFLQMYQLLHQVCVLHIHILLIIQGAASFYMNIPI